MMNPATRKHIRDKELHQLKSVIQMGRKLGMHTLDDSLIKLYEAGEITYDTALSNAQDLPEVRSRIHKAPEERF